MQLITEAKLVVGKIIYNIRLFEHLNKYEAFILINRGQNQITVGWIPIQPTATALIELAFAIHFLNRFKNNSVFCQAA